jgi:PHD/YefM family antitoxin component YafN of YafNO toxin-antitoxin module
MDRKNELAAEYESLQSELHGRYEAMASLREQIAELDKGCVQIIKRKKEIIRQLRQFE